MFQETFTQPAPPETFICFYCGQKLILTGDTCDTYKWCHAEPGCDYSTQPYQLSHPFLITLIHDIKHNTTHPEDRPYRRQQIETILHILTQN